MFDLSCGGGEPLDDDQRSAAFLLLVHEYDIGSDYRQVVESYSPYSTSTILQN